MAARLDVILVGPPGAGKGTQASRLCEREGLTHLSTGELLRQAIASGSALGREVKTIVEQGHLVPDATVVGLVEGRIGPPRSPGVLLDGFPRTVAQAELLAGLFDARHLAPPVVVEMVIGDDEVVRRLAARRTCAGCGPRPAGETDRCAGCSGPLTVRKDDAEDVVRERLRVYAALTAPLVRYYREMGLLRAIDAVGETDVIAGRIATEVAAARAERENPD